jgi:hypothetical protein
MTSRVRLYPYGPSKTAYQLVKAALGLKIRRVNSRYKYRPRHLVINWGSSMLPPALVGKPVLNKPEAVRRATSKQATFRFLRDAGVSVPDWTADRQVAQGWLQDCKVLGRDLDHGSQGRGITVYKRRGELGDHKFYVKYSRKEREFRVHVFGKTVIFIQEKLKKRGVENANKYIRSHDRGWCFAFNHLIQDPCPLDCYNQAITAVEALGLDFGAVDMGWNSEDGVTVFEVNTAPGLEGTSLMAYAQKVADAI